MNLTTIKVFIDELLFGTQERKMYSTVMFTALSFVLSLVIPIPLGYDPIVGMLVLYGGAMLIVAVYITISEIKQELPRLKGAVKESYDTAIKKSKN